MESAKETTASYDTALAIIGMAARLPGACNVTEFWRNLVTSTKSIRTFSDEELLAGGVDPELLRLPNYIKAGSILDDIDLFDAAFFQFSPREAEVMDPQHRLFLECAYEALQDAAYDPETYPGLVGVFAGSAISTYLLNNIATNPNFLDEAGRVQASIGNDRDSLANTISYKLNLRGPSFAVQTFCSTSLVAVHLACQSLLNYECDIALAGGVAIEVPQVKGYLYEEGSILSPDGECRTFDKQGRGSVMANGLGVVVLKRLQEALDDGDQISAVILGSHTNNDGSVRVSYTAPGLDGQCTVIAQALSNAGVDAETISYIEAHGTATMLGDAVELAAMKKAFGMRTQKKQFCAIGSVKPNIGHLDRASGVTGLIKTVLALKHQQLPPSLNFEQASDGVDLEQSPFYVNTQLTDWRTEGFPRRAGVSSFGLGGSNAHVVLEEAPELQPGTPAGPWQLLVLSAKTQTALEQTATNLHTYLQQHPEINLADAAYTLQIGRTAFSHRRFVVCHDLATALEQLTLDQREQSSYQIYRDRGVVFLFPGIWQTDSATRLLQDLYREEEVFKKTLDSCYDQARLLSGREIKKPLSTTGRGQEGKMDGLQQAVATFALEYALAQVWLQWGIKPAQIYGSAAGLYSAATVAGILTPYDALKLLIAQARTRDGLEPMETLADLIRAVTWHVPQTPFISPLTGAPISEEQALNADFWLRLLTVKASPTVGLDGLAQDTANVLLEVGSGQTLGTLLKQRLSADHSSAAPYIATFPDPIVSTHPMLLTALGQLWLAGVAIDWQGFYAGERRLRISLPPYPFERQHYWLEWRDLPPIPQAARAAKKPDIADWFYQPVWREAPPTPQQQIQSAHCWWIFEDDEGPGSHLAQRLRAAGQRVLRIQPGSQFEQLEAMHVRLRPADANDYIKLCRVMQEQQQLPDRIVHLWSVTGEPAGIENGTPIAFQYIQERGFSSLIGLVQGLNAIVHEDRVQMLIVSSGIQSITGREQLVPEKATLLGACKVIPQENLNITCRHLDLTAPQTGNWQSTAIIDTLLAECLSTEASNTSVAYRDNARLVLHYEPLRLEQAPQQKIPFRRQGVYLITGGLGGVGPILVEELARTYQATFILTGRSALPARNTWAAWIEQHEAQDEISVKLKHLLAAEEAGGQIFIMQADVSDEAQMRQVIDEIYTRYGVLNGILHAAGVTSMSAFKAIQELTWADCEIHFRPKVYGLYALERAVRGLQLDFCLLFSSVSVVLGGIAFSAYVAGNAFMDAFAQKYRQEASTPWLCVNWDTWFVKENPHGVLGATVADYVMLPEEGVEALTRILAHRFPHLVNSTGDLHMRLQQWVTHDSARIMAPPSTAPSAQITIQATALTSLTDYERVITGIWREVLGVDQIGLYDNFFDLGGNSLIAIQVISKLKKALRMPIPAVALFEAPTVSALVKYLLPEINKAAEQAMPRPRSEQPGQEAGREDIAIIGMTGRFPGASNVEEFWQNLRNGVESISFFSEEELIEVGVDPKLVQDPRFVPARPILRTQDVETFDAPFFGYSPREAEITDPQHRVFIECCWEALENASCDPSTYKGSIGVFGGSNISTYMLNFMQDPSIGNIDEYQMVIGNDKDSLTTSVSYKFDLKGPSFAVQTFCSTSLVAVHLACQNLLHGECDLALAGGVSIRVPMKAGHLYQEGGMESPDGHCRTFDAQARGSIFGDGVGVVVLKRLSDALADGDTLLAVIKGSAINNDGSLKVSYTAPSVAGQAEVVSKALAVAGVHPETISYIEAHGTATELGDPIEVASLTKAFRAQTTKASYCAIGSVKTNIGHLDRAAGVTGLIKTVLSLQHEELPPHLHFQSPNPEIDFEHNPFYVNTTLTPWKSHGTPRRAGINSLGLGGTNAHVIVEEAPIQEPSGPSRDWQLLLLSARTASALESQQQRLLAYLQQHPESNLADIANTLQVGRKKFAHRQVLLCRSYEEAVAGLKQRQGASVKSFERIETRTDRQVAFLFPGLGELYPGIARNLYQSEAIFRQHLDACHEFLLKTYGLNVHELLALDRPAEVHQNGQRAAQKGTLDLRALVGNGASQLRVQRDEPLARTATAQPIVFVIEYALAQLLMQWGAHPQAMLGYSLGEYVAACIAGVFSLEDALHLVVGRARLIDEAEHGAMLAVMASEAAIQPYLNTQISLAVQNSPNTCVLAGSIQAITQLEYRLQADDIACRRVETTHAFHSVMLQPLAEAVTRLAQGITLHAPRIPYLSNVTGTWITEREATDPTYWAQHMCQTVRFSDAVRHLLQETELVLVEVGPGQALSSFVKQQDCCDRARSEQVVSTLPTLYEGTTEQAFLLTTLGKLWLLGLPVDWSGFHNNERRRRIPLPTYPFERQRYWIEAQPARRTESTPDLHTSRPEEVLSSLKKEALSDWFYLPGWMHGAPEALPIQIESAMPWLLFLDEQGIGSQLQQQLERRQHTVITVVPGETFIKLSEGHYCLRPHMRTDYDILIQELQEQCMLPQRVVHCWTLNQPSTDTCYPTWALEHGFYSLMALAQSLGERLEEQACQIIVVSRGLYSVTGNEELIPEHATVIGPCKVIPQEYPTLSCRSIDFPQVSLPSRTGSILLQHLFSELLSTRNDPVVALRQNGRWVQTLERLHLPEQECTATPLREGGTYLITGGLGGIGLALAAYLARTIHANLILTSRNGLPPREQWNRLLAKQDDNQGLSRQIRQVLQLEALGAHVLPLAADVADERQMREAVQQAYKQFGSLHGVFHVAGVPGIGLMRHKTPEMAAKVLAPKVMGTHVLEYVLREYSLDFLVLFSSITAMTGGGPGQVDYCAANAFLDAYAQQATHSRKVISINWGEWQWNAWEAGLAGYDSEMQDFFKANRQTFGISFDDGMEALQRILSRDFAQIIVSPQNFHVLFELSKSYTAASMLQRSQQSRQTRTKHARPAMPNEYMSPQTELEYGIAAIWEDVLSISGIGLHDNFFDLGGNSLVGIDLITQMRKTLQRPSLPSYALYEAPTIETMAHFLEKEQATNSRQRRKERNDKRRESLRVRMRAL